MSDGYPYLPWNTHDQFHQLGGVTKPRASAHRQTGTLSVVSELFAARRDCGPPLRFLAATLYRPAHPDIDLTLNGTKMLDLVSLGCILFRSLVLGTSHSVRELEKEHTCV